MIDRRTFITTTAAAGLAGSLTQGDSFPPSAIAKKDEQKPHQEGTGGIVAISSANGLRAVTRASEMMQQGSDPLDAVVQGVKIVEDDPNDMSVGYGGLPNEEGVVELDSSVMHGPTHKAGAVAALQNIKNPASVALQVCRRTDHVLLVGEGALKFARAMGFPEENLLTDRARKAWLKWKTNLNPKDDWLNDDQRLRPKIDELEGAQSTNENPSSEIPRSWGTIHCSALDAHGNLGAVTTTSGLSYKIPGRVGDSPIIGAGMFVDNEVGSAGATGRGESVIQSCGSFSAVQHMANGDDPSTACLKVLKWIADHTKRQDLLNKKGQPNFGVVMYALRKDGAYGAASMHPGYRFSVHDGTQARHENCAALFE